MGVVVCFIAVFCDILVGITVGVVVVDVVVVGVVVVGVVVDGDEEVVK